MKGKRKFVRVGMDVVMPMMIESDAGGMENLLNVVKEWVKERYERLFRIGMANTKAGTLEVADVKRANGIQYRLWLVPVDATIAVLTKRTDCDSSAPKENTAQYQGFNVTPQTLHVLAEIVTTPKS